MDRTKPNVVLGCAVAPLAAPLAMLFIILLGGEDVRGPAYKYDLSDAKEMFGMAAVFLLFGAPIAYAITAVVGLPLYYVAKKLGCVSSPSITFGAALAAVLPFLLMSAPNGFVVYEEPGKSSLMFYLAFAICGFVVGLVFWFVSGHHRKPAPSKPLAR